jgi:hypothetical protein
VVFDVLPCCPVTSGIAEIKELADVVAATVGVTHEG